MKLTLIFIFIIVPGNLPAFVFSPFQKGNHYSVTRSRKLVCANVEWGEPWTYYFTTLETLHAVFTVLVYDANNPMLSQKYILKWNTAAYCYSWYFWKFLFINLNFSGLVMFILLRAEATSYKPTRRSLPVSS